MEILTIDEYSNYQDNMRNVIIMTFKGLGLCGMDQLLVVEDGDSLSPDEAISFLHVQQSFTFEYCNKYVTYGHVALIALGAAFRLLSFLLLRFARRSQY